MRLCVALALVSTLVSTTVLAAPKDEDDNKEGEGKKAGSSMDTDGDPAYTEKSDEGPYAPKTARDDAPGKGGTKASGRAALRLPARDKLVVFGELFYATGRAPIPGPASDGETPDSKGRKRAFTRRFGLVAKMNENAIIEAGITAAKNA